MAGHSAWKNIKHRKAAVDAKRGKIWSKLARALIVAAKSGGPDPKFNSALRLAVDAAKAANMPRDTIEKAVKKGSGYAPGGVAVLVEALVANVQKTAPEVRTIFDKNGGNLGVSGSVAYTFQHRGQVLVPTGGCTEEQLFEVALGAGAEDIVGGEEGWQVLCAPAELARLRDALESAGIALEGAELTYVPSTTVDLDPDAAARVARLVAALEEHDDVQKVHVNTELPDA
jgi:YebC/PmpR family DNA-binding regulatory protein